MISSWIAAQTIVKSVLILVAMEAEEKAILGSRAWSEVTVASRLEITAKTLVKGKNSVSVIRTGVGTVNAAVAVALFADKYPVTEIILLGVGGSLSSHIRRGETVLATGILQHDCVISHDTGMDLMAPGELYLSVPPKDRQSPIRRPNQQLMERLTEILNPLPKRGNILSGNEFVGSKQRKLQLSAAYPEALLVEMESAGVAQMADKMNIPFVVAKTAADGLSPKQGISEDYLTWIESSAKTAEQVITGVLRDL